MQGAVPQPSGVAMAEEAGMTRSIDGSGIDEVLEEAVDDGAVPHVAAIAADADGVFYEGGAGVRIAGESDDPVDTSTQFRIMSMTKMVCTTVALQQKERGELDFDAPVEDYLPEFADLKVLDGLRRRRPRPACDPTSKVTVHQLVTHTSGLGYWFWNDDLVKYEAATGIPNVVPGVDGGVPGAADRAPRDEVRLRHQHRLARPGRRGGGRQEAGRRHP